MLGINNIDNYSVSDRWRDLCDKRVKVVNRDHVDITTTVILELASYFSILTTSISDVPLLVSSIVSSFNKKIYLKHNNTNGNTYEHKLKTQNVHYN